MEREQTHITVKHRCGHSHEYRRGHEWPAHRYCFTCSGSRADWIYRLIAPHIRTRAGRYAVLRIIQELLEHEFTRDKRRDR